MDTSFERNESKEEYLTPPAIIKALGKFDLDPCSPIGRPWDTATVHYTMLDDGLKRKQWFGRVWLNPPYGNKTSDWIAKLKNHGNGIALIFTRTETRTFFDHIWDDANAIFFIRGRLIFHSLGGDLVKDKKGRPSAAGAPSCLVAYGDQNVEALKRVSEWSKYTGKFIRLKSTI